MHDCSIRIITKAGIQHAFAELQQSTKILTLTYNYLGYSD